MIQFIHTILTFIYGLLSIVIVGGAMIGIGYMWIKIYPKEIYKGLKNLINR